MTNLTKPITRKTSALDGTFGPDRGRALVVTLVPGGSAPDLIELKPAGRRGGATKRVALQDIYSYAIRCEVNRSRMERLRLAKEKKAEAKRLRELRAAARRDAA